MSRATQRSTVYVVADSVEQAAEDLGRGWKVERRLGWAIDAGTPARARAPDRGLTPRRNTVDEVLRRGRLLAERHAITAVMPEDPAADILAAEGELDRLRRRREYLEVGRGTYPTHPIGRAMREHHKAQDEVRRLEATVADRRLPRKARRSHEVELRGWRSRLSASVIEVADLTASERARIDKAEDRLTTRAPTSARATG